ncbi:unnamed protein product [Mytilus coruscus]|uniref:EF-hand domain-containing protein n=1 Tax=Mytilus coruscus TaxID=42192 RepID=A0A6J8B4U9_MYTCO|nr:unnamed protein product [Mytilus coruscus]
MKTNVYPLTPPEYSEQRPSGFVVGPHSAIHPVAWDIITPDHVADTSPPPAYDSIFIQEGPVKSNVHHDDRNLWEKVHEWFEMSVLQHIIWLGALGFAILYIIFSLKYAGSCYRKLYNETDGKMIEEVDLPSTMKVEGGILCASALFVFVLRLLRICDTKRTLRINKADYAGRQNRKGATRVFPFYEYDASKNYTLKCDPEFYSFYNDAKIGQLAIMMPYAAYIIIYLFIIMPKAKIWFIRRKWRQWASLLDANQDGIISIRDMEKTNARLELLRRTIGDRKTALNADAQKKWWDEHVFKRGVNKDISIEDYITYFEGVYTPHGMESAMRPVITGFFNFFSTPEYRKKNIPILEEDFIKFWTILKNVDESHCRRMFVRYFLNPLTMASFLENFVALISHNDFYDEKTLRVYKILNPQRSGTCDLICHPSSCNV